MHPEDPSGSGYGDPDDRESTLSAALSRLESDGAAILVGGLATPGVVDTAAQYLMGRPTGDRRRILVTGVGTDPGRLLPSGADRDPSHLRVLRYPVSTRSSASASAEATAGHPGDESVVTRRLDPDAGAVGRGINEAIAEFEDAGSVGPGDLRVWVDPLVPIFESHDRDDVVTFVRLVSDLVRGAEGRVHFRLGVRHGDRRLAALADMCDATVRLRMRERAEMCWHLGNGAASGWVPLEWTATGG